MRSRVALSILFFSAAAVAAPKDPSLTAGAAEEKAGKYADAIDKVRAALDGHESAAGRLRLAGLEAKAGRVIAAVADASQAFNQADDAKTRARADKLSKDLKSKISHLTVTVDPRGAGATVMLDGTANAALARGAPVDVDPGGHQVQVDAPGFRHATQQVTLRTGDAMTIKVALDRDAGAVATGPQSAAPNATPAASDAPPSSPPAADSGGGSPQRTIGIVVTAVGIVGVGVGTVLGLMAKSRNSDLKASCANGFCPASSQSIEDTRNRDGTLSTIAFAVGGAALVGGVVMLLTAPSSSRETASLSPYVGPASAGVVGRF